jgi:hypothetical protein
VHGDGDDLLDTVDRERRRPVHLHDASLAERIAGDQSGHERDHALAAFDRAQRRPDLAATVVPGDHVLAQEVGQAGEVAALRGVRKAGQQCGVFCVGEGELVAPGGDSASGRASASPRDRS